MTSRPILHLQKVAGISGSEAHLLALLPHLRARGWDVRMLMLHENEPGAWDFARALRARGVPIDAIPLRADFDPVAFVRIVAHLARLRPVLLHTHLVHADAYGLLAGTAARVPVRFSTKHGFNEFREAPYFGLADRAFASLAHVHIAISRGLARYLEDVEGFDDESFEIVHYGIDPKGDAAPYADTVPRLLCVGRLIPIKGHVVLLRAFAAARRSLPELELEIAGRGPLEPALKALARELGVAGAIRFLGHVAPIQSAIERAAVVVVPSMGEGFGMVALEAMERSRPVIAAEIGGLGELVRDGETGILVPAGEAEPLERAIVRLAGDLELARRMGEAGRARAHARFLQLLHRAHRAAVRGRARARGLERRVERSGAVGHPGDRELAQRPLASGRAERRLVERAQDRRGERRGVVRPHEIAGLAVDDELRQRADVRGDDGQSGEHRLEHAEPEALPARRVDEHDRAPEPRCDVRHPAEQEHAPLDAELPREREQGTALLLRRRDDDEHGVVGQERQCADRDVDALLRHEPRDREEDSRARGHAVYRVGAPGRGQVVHPVMDRLDLARRDADPVDREAPQRVGDRDDAGRRCGERALDVPERTDAERVVVVLRRDELRAAQPGGDAAVDVCMNEVRVYHLGAQLAQQP